MNNLNLLNLISLGLYAFAGAVALSAVLAVVGLTFWNAGALPGARAPRPHLGFPILAALSIAVLGAAAALCPAAIYLARAVKP